MHLSLPTTQFCFPIILFFSIPSCWLRIIEHSPSRFKMTWNCPCTTKIVKINKDKYSTTHVLVIVRSHSLETSKTFNNSPTEHCRLHLVHFVAHLDPPKISKKALHLQVGKRTYNVLKFHHTFPLGKQFKHKPLLCCLWWSQSCALHSWSLCKQLEQYMNTPSCVKSKQKT